MDLIEVPSMEDLRRAVVNVGQNLTVNDKTVAIVESCFGNFMGSV